MLIIIYGLIWILLAAAAVILLATGNFNETAMTIFGFLTPALFFAGVFGVLPWWMNKRHSRYLPQQ